MSQPFSSFGASGTGTGYSFGNGTAFKLPTLSPTQAAEVKAAQAAKPKNTILGDIEATGGGLFHGTTSALGTALNYLARPADAVDTALTEGVKAGDNFSLKTFEAMGKGFERGLTGHSPDTFSDYIRAKFPKFAAHHKVVTAIGGLAGTVLTDPTLPLIAAGQFVPGVDVGIDEAEAARLASLMGTSASSEVKAAQATAALDKIKSLPEDIQSAHMSARKALAQYELRMAHDQMAGTVPDLALQTEHAIASEAAKVEAATRTQKLLQLQYSIPFSHGKAIPLTPLAIKGTRVAPKLPSLRGAADAGIPLVSNAADKLGEAFKHGWGQESLAKPALAANTKAKQLITDQLIHYSHNALHPHFDSMTQEDMLKALNYGETRDGIVRGSRTGRVLNEKMLSASVRKGELTAPQGEFIRTWHKVMEHLRTTENSFGVVHNGSIGNKLYVPHTFLRDGGVVSKSTLGLKTNFGFAKERQNLTLAELKAAQDSGRFASHNLTLVTDPEEILAHRAVGSGNASAQHALHHVLAQTVGVPAKVADLERRSQALGNVRAMMKKQRGLTHIVNTRGTKASINGRFNALIQHGARAVLSRHQVKLDAIDEKITGHMEAAALASKRVPVASKVRGMSQKAFKASIAHFNSHDRVAAVAIHGRMAEGRRLENKLARLGTGRGGPQTKAKALAAEVEGYINSGSASLHAALTDSILRENITPESPVAQGIFKEAQRLGFDPNDLNVKAGGKLLSRASEEANKLDSHTTEQVDAALGEGDYEEALRIAKEHPQGQRLAQVIDRLIKHGKSWATVKPAVRGESWRSVIRDRLELERKSLQIEYNKLTSKYQAGKAYDHGKAVKRLMEQRERVMTKAAQDLHRTKFRINARRGAALDEWQKTFDRQARQYTNLQKGIEKEQRAYTAMKNNPHVPEGWIKYANRLNGQHYFFHPEIHAGLTNQEKAMNHTGIMQGLSNGYRKLLGYWKIGATSANPGYRFRNTASDVWNMYIAGVPTPRIVQYGKKAAQLQVVARRAAMKLSEGDTDLTHGELTALRTMNEMQLHGILSGLFQGDIQELQHLFHDGRRWRDYLNSNPVSLGKLYFKATQDMNRHVENWGRITHYLYRRDYQHLSAQASADWVKKAHFDYEELTPFEQKFMKSVFPFYTWTRKDIPYQLSQMASRPGKYAAFAQGIQTSNELATGNPHTPDAQGALMPDWMKQSYMFRIGGFGANAYVNPSIGVQDLSALEHPLTQGLGQHINPVAQVLGAVLTGKNIGTGQDIVGNHPRNPVSGFGADLLSKIPGSNVGPTERTVRGQTVQGVGANPWYTFAAQQVPGLNFLVNQESSIKGQQRGSGARAPLAYLSGLSVYNRDLQAEQTSAQLNFQDQMKKVLRGARDTGALAPSQRHKNSPFQIGLNKLIAQNGG